MSIVAMVFLTKSKRGLKFVTAWIDEEPKKAIAELGLEDTIPDGTVSISYEGRYVKYHIGKHDLFVLMVRA